MTYWLLLTLAILFCFMTVRTGNTHPAPWYEQIIWMPFKVAEWPVKKVQVAINEHGKYRYIYHTYCDDRPEAFSGICVDKLPKHTTK